MPKPRTAEQSIPIDLLHDLLAYNPKTGTLTWRARPKELFRPHNGKHDAEEAAQRWNDRFAGKVAGALDRQGYKALSLQVPVRGSFGLYMAHRVAYAMHYGKWPKGEIDHINGDPGDNCIINLRDATTAQNQHNQARHRNKTAGVYWRKERSRWRAEICTNSRSIKLGHFVKYADARAAREAAEKLYWNK